MLIVNDNFWNRSKARKQKKIVRPELRKMDSESVVEAKRLKKSQRRKGS
jgi:hypothetical protein